MLDHIGLQVQDVEASLDFYLRTFAPIGMREAMRFPAGAEVLHAPREWPEYHPGYYGVFLRDPDGHNVEAANQGSARGSTWGAATGRSRAGTRSPGRAAT